MTTATAGVATECAHCSLPVPKGRLDPSCDEQFCCGGCEAAYGAIRACGLDEYYSLRRRMETERAAVEEASGAFEEFDDESFQKRHCAVLADGSVRVELFLEGVHCAACLWLLERLPRTVDGLVSLDLDFGARVATVRWLPSDNTLGGIARALARFGYVPHAVEPSVTRQIRLNEERASLVRIGVAGACAGNVMLLAFALYSGILNPIGEPYLSMFRWLSAGIGLLTVAWPGRVFFMGAIAAVRARVWHMDMPVAAALLIGSVAGVWNVTFGGGDIYFDSLSMLVFLLLVGRWLQSRQQRLAHDSIELLFSVTPRKARVVEDGVVREIATDSLNAGDLIEVRPNESFPVDGVIETGETVVDDSVMTGESVPTSRGAGEGVHAGAVNLRGVVRVRAVSVGRATRVGQMMETIERLSRSRTPIVGSSDRVAGPFVIGVGVLSAAAFAIGLPLGLGVAVDRAVALLIVCCPCAAALAAPIATSAAIGRLAARGVLVKGGDVLEALAKTPTLVLDKTGTVTEGKFALREWIGDERLRDVVGRMEAGVSHPIATALVTESERDVQDVEHRAGLGVAGVWDGKRVAAGSETFMRELGMEIPAYIAESCATARRDGYTAVVCAVGERAEAAAVLGDQVREGAKDAIRELGQLGWGVELLSGDAQATTTVIAQTLGVERAEGGATPERKQTRAEEIALANASRGGCVMAGDGVNDAAALAAATVGIAVSGGAEASLAAADVYLRADGLRPLVDLAVSARRTVRVIRWCLGIAIGYNLFAGAAAIAGFVSPLAAAVVMPVSSVTVVTIALMGAGKERR